MKHITKGLEPHSLTHHRLQPHANYDNYSAKEDLRDALLAEQGCICCYCMRRIRADDVKIEHWACQDNHPAQQLDYQNLLAACDGGEGAAGHLHHCDTHKANTDITVHPADPTHNCELFIKYQANGDVYSDDPQIDHDLDETLNLNLQRISVNRAAVLEGAIAGLRKKRPDGDWTKAFLQAELNNWIAGAQVPEYCGIVTYYLGKKIAKAVN